MLFPFRDGDALPVTQWNSDRTELTVIMSSSVKKISFSEVSGSTRMEMVE